MNNNTARKPFSNVFSILRDRSGNVLPMAAVGTVVLAGLVGGGVDVSRGYMVQNRLQNACDAGVLAGRRAVDSDGFDTQAQNRASNYFNTNFDSSESGVTNTVFTPTSPDNGSTITATASATLDTTVMAIFNYDAMPLSVTCSASMSVGNSDIMMVLDTTGSMDWELGSSGEDRIDVLRDAMKSFYDTVASATSGSNARVRYGFVPYSTSVNVGALLNAVNTDYVADAVTVPSREAQFEEISVDEITGYEDPVITTDSSTGNTSKGSWSNYTNTKYKKKWQCQDAEPADTDWANYGSPYTDDTDTDTNSSGQQVVTTTEVQEQRKTEYRCKKSGGKWRVQSRTRYRDLETTTYETSDPIVTTTTSTVFDSWLYKNVTYDTSTFKTFSSAATPTGSNGTDEYSTWEGCIEERATVPESSFSWSSLTGYNHSGAWDLDIDTPPDPSNPDTQWKPLWSEVAYRRYTNSSEDYYSYGQSNYGDQPSSRCPVAARLFGTMTETEFDNYADSLDPEGSTYHNLGMIWGARLASPEGIFSANVSALPSNGGAVARHIIFMTDGEMSTSQSAQTAYGMEYWTRRVTDDGSSDHNSRHNERFLAVCEATKAKGIRLWVIAFGTSLTGDLVSCSSDDSSFTASNATQLNSAFQEIAKEVGELRITQ